MLGRRLAFPLLATIFVVEGLDAARSPGGRVQAAEKLGLPHPRLAVRANGAAMVAGGVTLAAGNHPRLAAVCLAASLVPTTLAGHRFWDEEDTTARRTQRVHFEKNLGLLGGLLLVATGPAPRRRPHRLLRRLRHASVHALGAAAEN